MFTRRPPGRQRGERADSADDCIRRWVRREGGSEVAATWLRRALADRLRAQRAGQELGELGAIDRLGQVAVEASVAGAAAVFVLTPAGLCDEQHVAAPRRG